MRLECPLQCGTDNAPDVDRCAGCGCPLRNHARLSAYAVQLFNQGLVAARTGELSEARELFAAVVHWLPKDRKARNALALANFELGDQERARFHWSQVLAQRASDSFATLGLQRLAGLESPTTVELPEDAGSSAEAESHAEVPAPAPGTPADVAPSADAGSLLDAEPSVGSTDTTPPADVEPLAADAQPLADAGSPADAEPQPYVEASAGAEPTRDVGPASDAESPVDAERSADTESPIDAEPSVDAEPSANAEPKAGTGSSADDGSPPDVEPQVDTEPSADDMPPADVASPSDNELSADAEPLTGVESARRRRWFSIRRWFGGG